jgi:hypothetical protein
MAEALEVNVLLRFMVRRDSAILELLLVTLICLVYGIGETVRGTVTSLLYLSAIAGALSAWGLGGLHLSGKRAWTVISILGLFGTWVRIGQLGVSLITLVLSISNIPIQFCSWAGIGIPTDFSAVTNSWGIVTVDSAALSARLIAWLGSLIHPRPGVDFDDLVHGRLGRLDVAPEESGSDRHGPIRCAARSRARLQRW